MEEKLTSIYSEKIHFPEPLRLEQLKQKKTTWQKSEVEAVLEQKMIGEEKPRLKQEDSVAVKIEEQAQS